MARAEPTLVSVVRNVSQLDEPVYDALSGMTGVRTELIYWNDYGLRRSRPDPELGVTPVFPEIKDSGGACRRVWLDSRLTPRGALFEEIRARAPSLVIFNDVPTRDKFELALRLRMSDVRVAFRSDKNDLSAYAARGLKRATERTAYAAAFDVFCPASQLSARYYRWPTGRAQVMFPYPTDIARFSAERAGQDRQTVRARLGLPSDAPVVLAVTKLVAREGPIEVLEAFFEMRRSQPNARLLFVGSGPDQAEMIRLVEAHGASKAVLFAGYVPYAELQDYFFAADIFVHLARREPWGVSVSDALSAGLAVVTSDRVGAGVELLDGPLARYVTPLGDAEAAGGALAELAASPGARAAFEPARRRVLDDYSSEATARRLADFCR